MRFKKFFTFLILPFVLIGFFGCAQMQKSVLKDDATKITDVDMEKVKANLELAKDYMNKFKNLYNMLVVLVGDKFGGKMQADAVMNAVDNALNMLGEKIEKGIVTDDVLALVKISLNLAEKYINSHMTVVK